MNIKRHDGARLVGDRLEWDQPFESSPDEKIVEIFVIA